MRSALTVIFLALLGVVAATGTDNPKPGQLIWSHVTSGPVVGSAAVDEVGRVYFGTLGVTKLPDGSRPTLLTCLGSDGKPVWESPFPEWVGGGVAVTESRVYVPCYDGNVHALDRANGKRLWTFHVGKVTTSAYNALMATPCVDFQGRIYHASRDGFLHAINPDGTRLWLQQLEGKVTGSPILDERHGLIYVVDWTNKVYAFNLEGQLAWSRRPLQGASPTRLEVHASPALNEFGQLFVASSDQKLYCWRPNRDRLMWSEPLGRPSHTPPVTTRDGRVFACNSLGEVHCYEVTEAGDPHLLWKTPALGALYFSAPVVDSTGCLYVAYAPKGAATQVSYLDGETGEALWKSESLPGVCDGSLVLSPTGDLYFGTAANRFHKMKGEGKPVDQSGWPMFHGAAALHGRFEQTFPAWELENPHPEGLTETPESDRDHDGLANFDEYAFALNPDVEDSSPRLVQVSPHSNRPAKLTFRAAKGIRARVRVEYSPNLKNWLPLEIPPWQTQIRDLETYWEVDYVPGAEGASFSPNEALGFFRVKCSE